jgi:epoxyqueuosine reductase
VPEDKQQPGLETRIKAKAAELGFVACGIARADAAPQTAARLHQWRSATAA